MVLRRFKCDPEVLSAAVSRFRNCRILVVGDLMLDRFIWGAVSRISPEAPVPVVEILKETTCLGGAANVAANISSLGGCPMLLGVVGNDIEGRTLQETIRKLGAPVGGLVPDRTRATSVKTRIIAHHQQVCRTDREDRSPIPAAVQERLIRRYRAYLTRADAVIVSDYGKGLICGGFLKDVLHLAQSAGKIVCVDPKHKDFSVYRPATVITPNTAEAERASGIPIVNARDLRRAGAAIMRRSGIPHLLVTRGEEGMALFADGDSRVRCIPTLAREVFDVTGAGDTVISTLALGLVTGLPMLQAAILANIAAGIVVAKLGTASATPEELHERIHSHD